MKNIIHQSPEERLAGNAESTNKKLDAIQEELRQLRSDRSTVNKLDEVKNANLDGNRSLKEMMPVLQRSGDAASFIDNFVKSIKGDDGYTPKKGKDYFTSDEQEAFKKAITPKKGIDYRDGKDGYIPIKGKDYRDGRDGFTPVKGKHYRDGVDGKTPIKGVDYNDGKDGSPDTPDQVVDKVNRATKQIDPARVKGLRGILATVDQIGRNPQGQYQNVGGANPLIIQDSTGARVSDYITTIKLGSGITPTYSAGVVTLTAAGGSLVGSQEKSTTVPNSVLTTFAFTHTPSVIVWNGAIQTLTDDYTVSLLTITFTASAGVPQTGDKILNIYA